MNDKSKKTFQKLMQKADTLSWDKVRMPSIKMIHKLLDDIWLKHWFYETQNVVEYKSKWNVYVNSRHDGKEWYNIEIKYDVVGISLYMDSSDSYYSRNTYMYARKLVEIINKFLTN